MKRSFKSGFVSRLSFVGVLVLTLVFGVTFVAFQKTKSASLLNFATSYPDVTMVGRYPNYPNDCSFGSVKLKCYSFLEDKSGDGY